MIAGPRLHHLVQMYIQGAKGSCHSEDAGASAALYDGSRRTDNDKEALQGIRGTRDEEMIGHDMPEMGVPVYPASLYL